MTGCDMKPIAIHLEGVSKTYNTSRNKNNGSGQVKYALEKISLAIHKGDRIGIIGSNGSGKSTLLKLIAEINQPTNGNIIVVGKSNSLIELSAGFHPDLSGYENIMLNGLLAGMSREEVKRKYRDIINFSGVAEYIDEPFYSYSMGMKLRLAFAVAVHSDPDILIFDEVVSAGDEKFISIFQKYIKELKKEKKTMIFASHALDVLSLYCERCIWLDEGKIRMEGEINEVIRAYKIEQHKEG